MGFSALSSPLLIALFSLISWLLHSLLDPKNSLHYLLFEFAIGILLRNPMKSRMPNSSLKQEFLKKWIKGLQIHTDFNKNTTVLERRKAIKLSADIAIASTRKATTRWSRAVIADASRDESNKTLIEKISGSEVPNKLASCGLINCSKKILKRSRIARQIRARRAVLPSVGASLIARKLVKSRTRVLKRLVPGGEDMDEVSLIKETIDYILSLRVQVDVMGRIASGADRLIPFKTL